MLIAPMKKYYDKNDENTVNNNNHSDKNYNENQMHKN